MARKNNLWLIATILLFSTVSLNALDVSGITIALPSDCSAKLRWVSPPLNAKTIREAKWYNTYNWYENFCFSVDATGQPWFAVPDQNSRKGVVLNPIQQYRFGLSHPFKGMVCLDNGALLFHTDHDLGFVSSPETLAVEEGVATVPFQPAITLPLPDCRIYSGANSALYIVGTADNGDNEVYLLQPETVSQDSQKIIRQFRRLFASQKPIEAVTGDGRTTFIALDRTIVQIKHEDQTQAEILVHPTGRIRQLAYSPTAGLFYVTDQKVGFSGECGTWDFLTLVRAQIVIRDNSLYICLSNTLGVLALDNISDLATYAPNGQYIPQARPSLPVEVTNIRFCADPIDPNGKRFYNTEFERSGISQVYGIVSLHPKSKQAINSVLTVVWDGPKDLYEDGFMLGGRVVDFFLHFKDGKDQQWQFRPTYMFYPGEYSMKVLLDGVEVKTEYFKVTGKTTVVEAALQDNTPLLKTLLEQGPDPDQRDSDGQSALEIAMFHGSTEAVKLLLKNGAQVNAKDGSGRTPLFNAALSYSDNPAKAMQVTKLLIKHGADVNAKDRDGCSVFDWSLRALRPPGRTDLVDLLLQHGASAGARDNKGQTLLANLVNTHFTSPFTKEEIVECLIKQGADFTLPYENGESLLRRVVLAGEAGFVRVLLEHGANPNKPDIEKDGDKCYPLLNISYYNPSPVKMLELLLMHGANPDVENAPGYTALSKAIEAADPASIWILLKYGVSLTADCRVNGKIGSPLRGTLSSYFAYAGKDRVKAQKAKDIFFMLLERGVKLRSQEEPLVADKRLHGWLPHEFILDVLKRNDRAVLEARDLTDARLHSLVIARLLEMAKAKTEAATSRQDYQAALALCDQAKTRAQVWKIESKCPLIYYNTGLLYAQLRQISAAKDNFKRYLTLAPNAPDAEAIRKSMGL
jgi:ankyrin repeat protein